MFSPPLLSLLIFAQQEFSGEDAVATVFGVICILVGVAIIVGVTVLIYYIFYSSLAAIPEQYRAMEPWQIFLLLIPCFNVVWIFFIVTKIPESFRNYFHAIGDYNRGDCGATIGLWYAIMLICASIPYLGLLFAIPALVLMIIFLVKLNELKNAVKASAHLAPAGGGDYYGGDPKNPYASPGPRPDNY